MTVYIGTLALSQGKLEFPRFGNPQKGHPVGTCRIIRRGR